MINRETPPILENLTWVLFTGLVFWTVFGEFTDFNSFKPRLPIMKFLGDQDFCPLSFDISWILKHFTRSRTKIWKLKIDFRPFWFKIFESNAWILKWHFRHNIIFLLGYFYQKMFEEHFCKVFMGLPWKGWFLEHFWKSYFWPLRNFIDRIFEQSIDSMISTWFWIHSSKIV